MAHGTTCPVTFEDGTPCPRMHYARGWCRPCYQWSRDNDGADPQGRPNRFAISPSERCTVIFDDGTPCTRPHRANGWCNTCNTWSWNHGGANPNGRQPMRGQTRDDVLAAVAEIEPGERGCRVNNGTFTTGKGGYAQTLLNAKHIRVSRLVLEKKLGRPLLPGMCACHHCDNPPCLEAEHLFEDTSTGNNHDRDTKGRAARGVASGSAILTDEKVCEVRRRYVPGTGTSNRGNAAELAAEYGVSRSLIYMIARRKAWAWLECG